MMENEHNRSTNSEKSKKARLAWKRNHSNYMRGARKRSRNYMNKTFYGLAEGLKSALYEIDIEKDNVFDSHLEVNFETISGGISLDIDEQTQNISISTTMNDDTQGNYAPEVAIQEDGLKSLYDELKQEISAVCVNFDREIKQILVKHGLKELK